jgi:hypothetical protein
MMIKLSANRELKLLCGYCRSCYFGERCRSAMVETYSGALWPHTREDVPGRDMSYIWVFNLMLPTLAAY